MKTVLFNNYLIKYESLFKILIFLIIFINLSKFNNISRKNIINKNKNDIKNKTANIFSQKNYYLFEFINNYRDKNLFFNITIFNYTYSFKYNILKVEYYIGFYDKNNNAIIPSDLTLYFNFQIFCHVLKLNNNINIESLASIYNNKYYKCIEFLIINDTFKMGIIVNSKILHKSYYVYLFNNEIINYNSLNINNLEFDPLIINKTNEYFCKKVLNYNETPIFCISKKLAKLYIRQPFFSSKEKAIKTTNNWEFLNVYNNYYCSCRGSKCLYKKVTELCKFNFYLTIIDSNKNVYKKTHYLFADFFYPHNSSDDTYPIFEEMMKSNLPVHYLTEKKDIYNKYCKNKKLCLSIILVNKENRVINGDFLEKYLTLFLKIKATISGAKFLYTKNLFYYIDYITHISVGHGIAILKQFLYSPNKYYGNKRYNKILLPPSDIIISIAKKHGWKDNNIIKINPPKWDKYKYYNNTTNEKIKRNSIFVMFTWRQMKPRFEISKYYIDNILKLINNKELIEALNKKNITLYFTLHHKIKRLKRHFKTSKNIEYIVENDIFECLTKTNLVITDFSSIIFDMICRKKPFIIYIPDANDPQIKNIYKKNYFNTIELFKKKSFNFVNKFFELHDAIKKSIYYINNNFKLEEKIKKFYKKFSFENGNNTKKFIEYLEKLK